MKAGDPLKVLFVCFGNTCRSPMAEILLANLASRRRYAVEARSAGTNAAGKVAEKAAAAVRRHGDLNGRDARQLTAADVIWADLILLMDREDLEDELLAGVADKKAFSLNEYAGISSDDVADPYTGDQQRYDDCAREVSNALEALLDRLEREAPVKRGTGEEQDT
jgi:protein-tyrosine-phosphatase